MTAEQDEKLSRVADRVDSGRKILSPIWALVVGFVVIVFAFGQFWSEYRNNAENGSPGVQKLIKNQNDQVLTMIGKINDTVAGQQKGMDKLTNLVEAQTRMQEMQNADFERRLSRVEDHK